MAVDPTVPSAQDLAELDIGRLTSYLEAQVGLAGPITASLIHGGRSNLTYRVTDGEHDWVLRRPPLGSVLPTAHDMAREHRVIAALHGTAVPVPRPVLFCSDPAVLGCDFYLMERVPGPVLRDAADTQALSARQAAAAAGSLTDTLATLHSVPVEVLEGLGRPDGYLARQVGRWRRQWSLSATRELPEIDQLGRRLAEQLPEPQAASIVHGDYRLDNVIFRPGDFASVAAVVDWEMATLGDPLADLGLLLVYWDPLTESVTGTSHAVGANPGFPDQSVIASRYAGMSGLDLSHLAFYIAFGYFKLAVIAEGIHARFLAGQTVGEGFDRVGPVVPDLLRRGLDTLAP